MSLTGDGHVHSEWSWDTGVPHSAAAGGMEAPFWVTLPGMTESEQVASRNAARKLERMGLIEVRRIRGEGLFCSTQMTQGCHRR
jgi:hypothetical protein